MNSLDKLVRDSIRELKPYSSARDEFSNERDDLVFLDANENPFGSLNRYPDPYQTALKVRLSELKSVQEDQIFIGNGSDEIIDLAFRIFCTPGKDKAVTFSPTYGMYRVSAGINNVELLELPLNDEYQINTENLKPILSDGSVKLMLLCSPNNPTGNSISRETIDYLIEHFKGILLVDEAYIDFSESASTIGRIEQGNLIVLQTFSKAWGLAGARVGAAYARKEIVELLNKVKPPYNVSQLNQSAISDALDNREVFEMNKAIILQERNRLSMELRQIDVIKKVFPSDANFILVEVSDAAALYAYLLEEGVVIRNRDSSVKNCLRLTVGTSFENQKLLNSLRRFTTRK